MKNILSRNERMSFILSDNDSILSQLPDDIICEKFCVEEDKICCVNSNKLNYCLNNNKIEGRKFPRMNINNMK